MNRPALAVKNEMKLKMAANLKNNMRKRQRAKSVLIVDIKPRFGSGSPQKEIESLRL